MIMRSLALTVVLSVLMTALMPLTACAAETEAAADTPSARQQFQYAEWALNRGDLEQFRRLSASLNDYPLAPDLAIAAVLRDLEQAQAEPVEALIKAHAGTAPGERLRRLWLGRLAREQRRAEYVRLYVDNGSETRECLYRRGLLHTKQTQAAFAGLEALYLIGRSLPAVCDPLFAAWSQAGQLEPAIVWQRIELALARGATAVARHQGHYLPAAAQPWLRFRLAAAQAKHSFPSPPQTGQTAQSQHADVIAAALADFARHAPDQALEQLNSRFDQLPTKPAGRVHAAAGLALAEQGEQARALAQLDQLPADAGPLSLYQQRLRVGLKLGAWEQLPRWIQALPASERKRAQWHYWLGRALEEGAPATADASAAAQAAYRRAASDRSLWGFLAAEHLGVAPKIAHQPVAIDAQRLQTLLDSARAARLQELKALGRATEIKREWREYRRLLERTHQGTTRSTALQEAAALAQALDFPVQAIFTLARSGYWDDLALRFPLLYTDLTREAAQRTGLPQAWLLAIIRQESIFNPTVASSANAVGLMQLLPGTARQVAQRLKLPSPNSLDLTDPALNIRLGSAYLAQLYQRFDAQSAVATAAYNAGPTAVQRWLPQEPMPADVWIATIPYRETRSYVARVLAYRLLYAHRLGQPLPKLSELLPPVRGD
ncbi:lytic transglycosylase domain-containing protein [Rhabdochromatium marinum]|uniref:lytic transglycosylase domain-containing protein n=1 Tax=Rhabdochromatium marinum TaxID=48729 RepID=UPI00190569CE|nr:lytic transglycosylase domain-containing protein [Rhabdochromatium marinum]